MTVRVARAWAHRAASRERRSRWPQRRRMRAVPLAVETRRATAREPTTPPEVTTPWMPMSPCMPSGRPLVMIGSRTTETDSVPMSSWAPWRSKLMSGFSFTSQSLIGSETVREQKWNTGPGPQGPGPVLLVRQISLVLAPWEHLHGRRSFSVRLKWHFFPHRHDVLSAALASPENPGGHLRTHTVGARSILRPLRALSRASKAPSGRLRAHGVPKYVTWVSEAAERRRNSAYARRRPTSENTVNSYSTRSRRSPAERVFMNGS